MIEQDIKEKVKEIYEVLPKLNDRRCGYRTCGEFARAVVKGEASCYGCVSGGYTVTRKICNIMGEKVSAGGKIPSGYYSRAGDFVGRFGRGRGYRNRYYAAGIPGSGRYKSDLSGRSGVAAGYNYRSAIHQNKRIMDVGQERAMFKQQADSIRKRLDNIEERISKLKKSKRK
jgi:hypothetical protein